MSKNHRLETLSVSHHSRDTTETKRLEARVIAQPSRKSAWSLTKVKVSSDEMLK